MSPAQEEFFEKCPAWARKEGIESLAEWQIVEKLLPLSKADRFDQIHRLTAGIESVLDFWDAMGEQHDN